MYFRPQLPFVLVLCSLGILPSPAAAANGNRCKLDRKLVNVAESGSPAAQSVIIRTQPGQLADVENRIKAHAHGDAIESRHPAISALSARVTAADLDVLANDNAI